MSLCAASTTFTQSKRSNTYPFLCLCNWHVQSRMTAATSPIPGTELAKEKQDIKVAP